MNKILKTLVSYVKNNKINTLLFITILLTTLVIATKHSSAKFKNEVLSSTIVLNNQINTIKSYASKNLIKRVSIVEENSLKYYTFFIEKKDVFDNTITYDEQYIQVKDYGINQDLNKLFIDNKIPMEVYQANFYDYYVNYVKNPFVKNIVPLFSNIYVIIMVVFLLFSISIMMARRKNKEGKQFEIIYPNSIKGSLDTSLAGMQDIKDEFKKVINIYHHKELYKEYGIEEGFNIQLSGPAGTGKSKIASYLAKELNMPLIVASASRLETGLVGGGAETLDAIKEQAIKLKRCIVFLDEAQALFSSRKNMQRKYDNDTSNHALTILDGVASNKDAEIIWIAASNFNDANMDTDEAMNRRFPLKIDFRLPNKEERKSIFELYLKQIKEKYLGEIDLNYLSEITSGLSPALIQTVVKTAAKDCASAKKTIETKDVYTAFEKSSIGITNRQTTKENEEKRKIIAIHELGHFFIDFIELKKQNYNYEEIKEKIKVLKISTESVAKINALGYVLSKPEDIALHNVEELEQKIKALYGGVVAEEIYHTKSKITTGSSNDIEKVTSILELMFFKLGMYSDAKLNYSILKNSNKNDELMVKMEQKATTLYNETRDMLTAYKDYIDYLLSILLEKYVLTIDEILELIEKYEKSK